MTGLEDKISILNIKINALEQALDGADEDLKELQRENLRLQLLVDYYRDDSRQTCNRAVQTEDIHCSSCGHRLRQPLTEWFTNNASILSLQQQEFVEAYGYIYDPRSGLYHNADSGYYYVPRLELFYHPDTDLYYRFSEEDGAYVVTDANVTADYFGLVLDNDQGPSGYINVFTSQDYLVWAKFYGFSPDGSFHPVVLEVIVDMLYTVEQEIDGTGAENTSSQHDVMVPEVELNGGASEGDRNGENDGTGAESTAPCIRAIVTASDCLDLGSLHIVTIVGAVVGRARGCDIQIPVAEVSKKHALISYDSKADCYAICDCRSKNGIFLSGKRVKVSRGSGHHLQHLNHCDILRIGSTEFSLHIHQGSNTCRGCEPGLCSHGTGQENGLPSESAGSVAPDHRGRHQVLKAIKRKYGLQSFDYQASQRSKKAAVLGHQQRARRSGAGPADDFTPDALPSSVHRALPSDSKGFKMLENMGWQSGRSLGRSGAGIMEPVGAYAHFGRGGLGSTENVKASLDEVGAGATPLAKRKRWMKAQERYRQSVASGSTKASTNTVKPVQSFRKIS